MLLVVVEVIEDVLFIDRSLFHFDFDFAFVFFTTLGGPFGLVHSESCETLIGLHHLFFHLNQDFFRDRRKGLDLYDLFIF